MNLHCCVYLNIILAYFGLEEYLSTDTHHNLNEKEQIMSKGEDSKKTEKKAPAKTPKEKKADKQIKKAEKKK
jgi:hypothetical protein